MTLEGLNPAFDPALLSRIEDAGLNASAPPQQLWLDGWLVCFSPGKAKRARCVNAVAAGRLPIDGRLRACEAVFAEAGLPMIVRITPFTLPQTLDALLASQGMHRFDDTRVMALADLSALSGETAALPPGAEVHATGLEAFAQRVGSLRGSPLSQRQAHGQRLQNSPVPFHAFEMLVDSELVACGQIAIEGPLVGLYDVFTAPNARGRGYAGALCHHMLQLAHTRDAKHAYLQVDGDNHAARAVYQRLGFADAYAYHYRTRDPAAA
ncbi:MAG: GNAT family N-acetyltransferase [Burkholderiales bacterium]|nr:GNAT family N-acetyltransferase [Burkholderiales bacterium]